MSAIVEAAWPIEGLSIPRDHGYLLWAALAERVPALYREPCWAVGPIMGPEIGGRIMLVSKSAVRLRLPALEIGEAFALTGAEIKIGLDVVRLGMPKVAPLCASKALRARVFVGQSIGDAVEIKLREDLGSLPIEQDRWAFGVRVGTQRLLRTRSGSAVMTHDVTLSGLTPHASIVLQSAGIGGRRHLGAGFFETAA